MVVANKAEADSLILVVYLTFLFVFLIFNKENSRYPICICVFHKLIYLLGYQLLLSY